MSHEKILSTHLNRLAVIYIRQSSPQQVREHLESQRRQYQLTERAQALGWQASQCVIIDDDQAISASQSYNRPGYQRIISMLALREVGIVLGIEVSRLARNNLDWYQMLELAAAFNVLIADEDGVYDPGNFNDRLLLGLKGTISEVELYQIRARMVRGRLNKVKRGELIWNPAVGFERDPITKELRLSVDQSVRHSVESVFRLFGKLHSIRGVLKYMSREGLDLPYQKIQRGLGRQILWHRPTYDAIYHILTNPLYAGVYCYGRRQRQRDPLSRKTHTRRVDRSEWEVFIPDHHQGYITLTEFEENQRILENNRYLYSKGQGAPREGEALLQGLVYCKHCGRKMRVRYSQGKPYYTCDKDHHRYGTGICNRASAHRVDTLDEELFLTIVNAGTLELSISHDEKLRKEATHLDRSRKERLQRLEYEADLARRRYEFVDPANRLVAQTLETEWNQRLFELEKARREYQSQKVDEYKLSSTLAQMQGVIAHLRDHWYCEAMSSQDKKELLRCLIEQVFLKREERLIRAQVNWYGGAVSELDVPKYLSSTPRIYHRIVDLAKSFTDTEIARILNEEGLLTCKGKSWTSRHVMDFRLSNSIPSSFTTADPLRRKESGFITSAEAAIRLGVHQTRIQRWYRLGMLPGKHAGGQSALWIEWSKETFYRLGGEATPDPRMVSLRSLCRLHGKNEDEALRWAQENKHQIYRLRRGSVFRFYILPADPV
jgi:DNA invertase Pin-like site-specific DNA recombinase